VKVLPVFYVYLFLAVRGCCAGGAAAGPSNAARVRDRQLRSPAPIVLSVSMLFPPCWHARVGVVAMADPVLAASGEVDEASFGVGVEKPHANRIAHVESFSPLNDAALDGWPTGPNSSNRRAT